MVIKLNFEIFDPFTYIKLIMWFLNKSIMELQNNIEILG